MRIARGNARLPALLWSGEFDAQSAGFGSPTSNVYEEGSYNALLVPLLRHKFLLINGELLKNGNPDAGLRFIVGRFVGAPATKHYRFMWLQVFLISVEKVFIFNLLLYPHEWATSTGWS